MARRRRRRELWRVVPPSPKGRLDEAPDEILDQVEGGLFRGDRASLGLAARGLHRRLRRWEALVRIRRLFARHWFDRHAYAVIRDCMAHLPPGARLLWVAPTIWNSEPWPWHARHGWWSNLGRGRPPRSYMLGGPLVCPLGGRRGRPWELLDSCRDCNEREGGPRPLEYAVWGPQGRFRRQFIDDAPILRFMCGECFFGDEVAIEPVDVWHTASCWTRHAMATADYAPEVRYVPCARDHRAHRAPIAWRPATGLRPPRPLFPAAPRQN